MDCPLPRVKVPEAEAFAAMIKRLLFGVIVMLPEVLLMVELAL